MLLGRGSFRAWGKQKAQQYTELISKQERKQTGVHAVWFLSPSKICFIS